MDEQGNEPAPPVPRGDAGPTEEDEETVLTELYGPPGSDGVYRGFVGGELADENGEAAE